ncbi:hypothetical protein [Limnochorda pilosa]|uniref:hypothetical protein n=1 Tax=Limnochorda pilosa TaxID=1555112 RepID=UPI00130DC3C0|nr:hypothetical protein [Limnochorda pilosa]
MALMAAVLTRVLVQPKIAPVLRASAENLPLERLASAYGIVDAQLHYGVVLRSALQGSLALGAFLTIILLSVGARVPLVKALIATAALPAVVAIVSMVS